MPPKLPPQTSAELAAELFSLEFKPQYTNGVAGEYLSCEVAFYEEAIAIAAELSNLSDLEPGGALICILSDIYKKDGEQVQVDIFRRRAANDLQECLKHGNSGPYYEWGD